MGACHFIRFEDKGDFFMYDFYLYYVIGVMFLLPVISIIIEIRWTKSRSKNYKLIEIMAKWFIFWGIGMRTITGGLSQTLNPAFTAELLQVPDSSFVAIVEIGMANISIGLTALISLVVSSWRKAAGFCGGVFLGMAGFLHVSRIPEGINLKETIAMISDLYIFLIVIIYLIYSMKNRRVKKEN